MQRLPMVTVVAPCRGRVSEIRGFDETTQVATWAFVDRVESSLPPDPETSAQPPMPDATKPSPEDIEHLLRNAHLRDALEPYLDESVSFVDTRLMPTPKENEFLESMLAWERAPILPISQWFTPELVLPAPDTLDEQQLHEKLWETIGKLYDQRVVLEFTEHLSDRELYCLIYRDILPSPEKKIDLPKNFLHWHCLDDCDDEEIWLTYYASDIERQTWRHETGGALPAKRPTPYPRKMPRRP